MTDYKKLVEALRVEPFEVGSVGVARVMQDAAAAIEELQGELEKLKSYLQTAEEVADHYEEKAARLEPKRGEWFEENIRPRSSQFVCSECHGKAYYPQPTRDKMWTKRCGYAYCPHCGADMRKMEVQDG